MPTALYSLTALGFNRKAFDLIRVLFVRQVRAIARSPRHLTAESDVALLGRLHIPSPMQMVLQMQTRIVQTNRDVLEMSGPEDFRVHPLILQRGEMLLCSLQELDGSQTKQQVSQDVYQCDVCDKAFDNEAALRQHKARLHSGERQQAAPTVFDRQRHGTDGMPQCSGCGHKFERWDELRKHIVENHCQGRIADDVARTPSFASLVQTCVVDLTEVSGTGITAEMRQELMQHCSLCRQWFPNDKYVRQHWTRVHKEEGQQFLAAAKQWRKRRFAPVIASCAWCNGTAARKADHRETCPVLFQMSMVWAIYSDSQVSPGTEDTSLDLTIPAPDQIRTWQLKCQLCLADVTARGLRKHMSAKHAEFWQKVTSQVERLCSSWTTGLHAKTCQFCHSTYDKRAKHALSCHAIAQAAISRVRASLPQSREQSGYGADSSAGGGANAGGVWASGTHGETSTGKASGPTAKGEAAEGQSQGPQAGEPRLVVRGRRRQTWTA